VHGSASAKARATIYDVTLGNLSPGATVVFSNVAVTDVSGSAMLLSVLGDPDYQGANGASITVDLQAIIPPVALENPEMSEREPFTLWLATGLEWFQSATLHFY
jgi:hypothetical protein